MTKLSLWLAIAVLAGGPAYGQIQTPGQITPRSFAPEPRSGSAGVTLPSLPDLTAPEGSEKTSLKVGDVVIDGGDPQLEGAVVEPLAALKGRTVTVAEIYTRANEIERIYAKAGYFLTRVTIPQQTVKPGGTLRILVTRGFIESIDTSEVPERGRARAENILAPMIGRIGLTSAAFQRALLLTGDIPGLDIKTSLSPGTAVGAVRLIVTGTHKLFKGEATTENALSQELGVYPINSVAALNSPLGFGEQFYFGLSGTPANGFFSPVSPLRTGAFGVAIPIGVDGLTFNAEIARAATTPMLFPPSLPTDSHFQRLTARLTYPLLRSRTANINIRAAFDALTEIAQAPTFGYAYLYEDQLRIFRAGFTANYTFPNGTYISGGAEYFQGISGLGSRGQKDVTADRPISRAIADDVFSRIEANVSVRQELIESFTLEVSARTQLALSGPLMRSQQFSVTGRGAVSAYNGGVYSGDEGWLVRAEVQYQAYATLFEISTSSIPYVFLARGQTTTLRPTDVEIPINGGTAAGFGVRTTFMPSELLISQLELGFEMARQFSDLPAAVPDGWRFGFYGTARF